MSFHARKRKFRRDMFFFSAMLRTNNVLWMAALSRMTFMLSGKVAKKSQNVSDFTDPVTIL